MTAKPKAYGYEMEPLPVDWAPAEQVMVEESKRKTQPGVAWAPCPDCTHLGAALVRDGDHLVWRVHWVRTYGHADRQCRASGQRLCDAPARKVPQAKNPTCPCSA